MELLMLSFQTMELDYVTPKTHKPKIHACRPACNTQAMFFCCSMFIQMGGARYATLGIRAFRPGKRGSKAPRPDSSAPRFGGALCGFDCALLARLMGRRRRRELLASRLLRQPRGGSSAAGMGAHVDLLSYQRVCRSRGRPRTRVRDRQNLPQCHRERERKPPSESRSGLAHANLHIRHAGFGGPAYCRCHWTVWPR